MVIFKTRHLYNQTSVPWAFENGHLYIRALVKAGGVRLYEWSHMSVYTSIRLSALRLFNYRLFKCLLYKYMGEQVSMCPIMQLSSYTDVLPSNFCCTSKCQLNVSHCTTLRCTDNRCKSTRRSFHTLRVLRSVTQGTTSSEVDTSITYGIASWTWCYMNFFGSVICWIYTCQLLKCTTN